MVHGRETRASAPAPVTDAPKNLRRLSDVLPFGQLWYDTPDNAIGYAMHSSRSHDAVIRVYDVAGNVIETQKHGGDFREW